MAAKSRSGDNRGAKSTRRMGWAAALLTAHTSPLARRGILVSDQVRLTTVTPCRSAPARGRKRRSGTRALRFVASACIPTGSPAEAQARFSEDPARILQDMDQSSTARHYRQAKQNSQNLLTIAIGIVGRQPLARISSRRCAAGVSSFRLGYAHCSWYCAIVGSFRWPTRLEQFN